MTENAFNVVPKLMPDSLVKLMSFAMAGAGYEMANDAREGEDFEFIG